MRIIKIFLIVFFAICFISGCKQKEQPNNQHEHIECSECGKCTDPECDDENNKCLGHIQDTHN